MHLGASIIAEIGFDRVGDWFSYLFSDVLFNFSSEKAILIRVILLTAVGVLAWVAYGTLRVSSEEVENDPANLAEPMTDDELEGRRLERVLGLGLFMAIGIAIAMPVYFMREPYRTQASEEDYQNDSVKRGRTFYANAADEEYYDGTKSQQCANCHGSKGEGGSAPVTLPPVRKDPDFCLSIDTVTLPPESGDEARRGPMSAEKAVEIKIAQLGADETVAGETFNALDKAGQTAAAKKALMADVLPTELPRDCQPSKGAWAAPPLNTVLLRFPRDDKGETEVSNIITYGRPGTPMAAFGVAGGGAKNTQAISDLVNYIETLQLTPEQAKEQNAQLAKASRNGNGELLSSQAYATSLAQARQNVKAQEKALEQASAAIPDAEAGLDKAKAKLSETELTGDAEVIEPAKVSLGAAERKLVAARESFAKAEKALDNAKKWEEARAEVSLGQVLFETHCARCHTKNWSVFDASNPFSDAVPAPGASGGGAFGFNLRGRSTLSQFPDVADHIDFIANGSKYKKQYGVRGIGTGGMPGFGMLLSEAEIEAIVEYERALDNQPDPWTIPESPAASVEDAK